MPSGIPKNGINKGWLKKGHHQYKYPKNGNTSWYKKGHLGLTGEKNPSWKGDNVGYWGVHDWIKKELGPAKNQICACGEPAKNWANLYHTYNRDLNDFKAMCVRCHRNWDYKYNSQYAI